MDNFENNQENNEQQNPYQQQPYQPEQSGSAENPYSPNSYQQYGSTENSYSQSSYQQPAQQYNYYQQPGNPPAKSGLSIASMVLGILSILFFCIPYISIPLAIVGLILGIISLVKKQGGKGMAIAGVICSAIGFVIGIIIIIMAIAAVSSGMYSSPDFWSSFMEEYQQ
ncbi:MAG TPA: DUF4190 domain-containing protein [Oscillospiraceae bacterium]|nr:DUF4190 domain-containing protein [Oscillospiraceae bacterium]